jgi:tetratricopeptide (TPR) repeat protein
MPAGIKKVAVLNRSEPVQQNRILDAFDKALSLEGVNLDKDGAYAGLNGLTDELWKNNRFTDIKVVPPQAGNDAAPGTMPTPLSWNIVERICRENNVDAVFTLEFFDTDTKITYAAVPVSQTTPTGPVQIPQQQANMQTIVKTGWRIYDLHSHDIVDEYRLSRTLNYSAKGATPVIAAAGLVNRSVAVKEAGNNTGHAYAQRIVPYWLRVYRDYYIKGSENLVAACRMARTGNWDGAAQLWKKETSNPDPKIAGRAYYNMAIASEISGDLDQAITWASRAYEQFNIRLGLNYVNILKNRKSNDALLAEQQAAQ